MGVLKYVILTLPAYQLHSFPGNKVIFRTSRAPGPSDPRHIHCRAGCELLKGVLMKNVVLGLGLVVALTGCSSKSDPIEKGSDVPVSNAASTAKPSAAATSGEAPAAPAPAPPGPPAAPEPDDTAQRKAKTPEFREVTVPAGTVLRVTLSTAVASDTSQVEDAVRATLQNGVTVDGLQALPIGTTLLGHVTSAERSAKVKGRASVGVRFNSIDLPGDGGRESIQTATITRGAAATKKKDATKIGIGAGAGAVIGGIMGGGSGAAKGAAIGGGAGTGAVLATRGDEVRLPAGTPLSVKLTAPLTVRVPR
jgi:hypothetical protein